MTRPRPQIEIATHFSNAVEFALGIVGEYNGVLEKPIISIAGIMTQQHLMKVLTHEYIHWVLHKRLGEDACHLLDRISLREYS